MRRLLREFCLLLMMLLMVCGLGCNRENETIGTSDNSTEADISKNDKDKLLNKSVEEIVANMTLEQKAAQMIQPAVYNISMTDMKKYNYGSILSHADFMDRTEKGWRKTVDLWQKESLQSESGIPYVFGNDAVHGVNVCVDAVLFPHNIGIGAANDVDLTYKMGAAVANEIKLTGMLWNFSPCLAVATEPRWGRTYESYSSDTEIVKKLGEAYTKGQVDNGIIVTAKHYIGDGNIGYGTGEGDNLIDRGDASVDVAYLDKLVDIYRTQVEAGAQTIMISHSSLNGIKMHANEHMITDVLKGELNFEGFVVSDWESIHNIPGTPYEQVVTAVNAGIDMLMEADNFQSSYKSILKGVETGDIKMERIDDAVTRILKVKKNAGLLDDPYLENQTSDYDKMGSEECRTIARQLVEKSMVLLKNDNDLLPIKKGSKIFIIGPAANDTGVLCGGWTYAWQGGVGENYVSHGSTILDGFQQLAKEYDLTIITDAKKAREADITILCVGETPYAEWYGDTEDMSISGALGLEGNKDAIRLAKELGKPTITLMVAGRNVIYDEYEADWNSIVMCYLPGSEGNGVANVLTGKSSFSGKLPMSYYSSISDLEAGIVTYEIGYGLEYKK